MNKSALHLNGQLNITDFIQFVFNREQFKSIEIAPTLLEKSQKNFDRLNVLMEKGLPIYGVTTGFGDNALSYVDYTLSAQLQKNLVNYLSCGLGDSIPVHASRAMCLVRLNSLSQGISAVSQDLLLMMKNLLELDILPVVPCEGSLGASGDLIPLAYLAQVIQGEWKVHFKNEIHTTSELFKKLNITPYVLKPKEGLALVNGTSTMAGMMTLNLQKIDHLVTLAQLTTAIECFLLEGKREAFGPFVNEVAKKNHGQKTVAKNISLFLDAEGYKPKRGQDVLVNESKTEHYIQDRYSLRCVPQILGPIVDYQKMAWDLLDKEINSVSDNPILDDEGNLEMGGNFYGGYVSQAMDLSKINLAHMADLIDRQIMLLFDEKTRKNLSPNLIDLKSIPKPEHHINHGLKGLHQAASAITSEVIQKSIPNGIFSRSSESHNQDKVSLGMSSASVCLDMTDGIYKLLALQLVCLCQALDLKEISLKSENGKTIYSLVRRYVPKVKTDQSLGLEINNLISALKEHAFYV